MGIVSDYHEAFVAGDKEKMNEIIHDDCKFIPHVGNAVMTKDCLLYTSPSPRDRTRSRMPSSA